MPRVSVYRRAETKVLYLRYRDEHGKQVRRPSGTTDPEEAERVAKALEKELERKAALKDDTLYAEAVIDYIGSLSKPGTIRSWRNHARRWDELVVDGRPFRDLYLSEITDEVVGHFVQKRKKQKVTDASIRAEIGFLSALFSYCGWKARNNPVKLFEKNGLKKARKIVRYLSADEEERVLAACRHQVYRQIIIIAIETGMRKMEICRMRWRWVNLESREIYVPFDIAKDKESRIVPISGRAMAVFKELLIDGDKPDHEDSPVFKSQRGDQFHCIDKMWKDVKVDAKVECRFHDLRHTFATRWLKDGGDITALSHVLGHSNLAVTMRYAHLLTESLHYQMQAIDRVRMQRLQAQVKRVSESQTYAQSA